MATEQRYWLGCILVTYHDDQLWGMFEVLARPARTSVEEALADAKELLAAASEIINHPTIAHRAVSVVMSHEDYLRHTPYGKILKKKEVSA